MDIGVLVVHGIGTQNDNFAKQLIANVDDNLSRLVPGKSVVWQPAFWADLLNQRERDLWSDLTKEHELDWATFRKFVINVLADAIAYRQVPANHSDMYRAIHARIHEHLKALRASLGNSDKPLVIVAHSLGSVILSNYIWDEQAKKGLGATALERMETLTGIVTFGSNIPLFTLALDRNDIECIEFPPRSLPPELARKAKWLNLFDADDILGYPLKSFSPHYGAAVTEDREINVGNFLTSWNPASHTGYWRDGDFVDAVSEFLADILRP